MNFLTKDSILESCNGTLPLDRPEEGKCVLEIIYHVHGIKRFSHPFFPPQREHIQIMHVYLYYVGWKFLCSSIKNGHSSYGHWATKQSQSSGGVFSSFHTTHNWIPAKKQNTLRIWPRSWYSVKLPFLTTRSSWLPVWWPYNEAIRFL